MVKQGQTLTFATEYVVPLLKGSFWKYRDYPNSIETVMDINPLVEDGLARVAWVELKQAIANCTLQTETAIVSSKHDHIYVESKQTYSPYGETRQVPVWSVAFGNPSMDLDPIVTIRRF
jgi:hypothetical protein